MPGAAPFVPQHGEQPEKPQWSEQKAGQGTGGGVGEGEPLPVAPQYDHADQQVADGLSSEPPAGREVCPRKQRRRSRNARTNQPGTGRTSTSCHASSGRVLIASAVSASSATSMSRATNRDTSPAYALRCTGGDGKGHLSLE